MCIRDSYWSECLAADATAFCVCAMLASERPAIPDDVATEVAGHFDDLRGWLTAVLAAGEAQGTFRLSTPAPTEAAAPVSYTHLDVYKRQTPVIAPAGFVIYSGDLFPYFRGHGFIGGLASQSLVRIQFDGVTAREAERYAMGRRIREVEQGPDGALWLLEDGAGGRLLKLMPLPL